MTGQIKEIIMADLDKTQGKQTRQKRVPFGTKTLKLGVNKTIEGFHLRYINDEPGRLHRAEMGGYSFVSPEEVGLEVRDGERVRMHAGIQADGRTPLYSYLMKIPMEFHEEDVRNNQATQDSIDASIRGGTHEGRAGDGRYIPQSGIKYST